MNTTKTCRTEHIENKDRMERIEHEDCRGCNDRGDCQNRQNRRNRQNRQNRRDRFQKDKQAGEARFQHDPAENKIRRDKLDQPDQPETESNHTQGQNESVEETLDPVLTWLEAEMDRSFMETGKTVAELFRAVSKASVKLPTMELHTEMMCLCNSKNGMTIVFTHSKAHDGDFSDAFDDDCEDDDVDFEDEEEGFIYDGD